MSKSCAVIGSGYWGENHIRILSNLDKLNSFYDKNLEKRKKISEKYKIQHKSLKNILNDTNVESVFITTPSESHINILKLAIKHNKHIFVEKPLVTNIKDLNEIKKLIKNYNKITMVGHLMIYHSGIMSLKELIKDKKKFGKLRIVEFYRRNFGKIRNKETAFMSFTPHDLSIASFLTSSKKDNYKFSVNMNSFYRNQNCYDMGVSKFLINKVECYFNYSWISPEKKRKILLYFDKAIVIFDDLKSWDEKIQIINSKKNIIKSDRESLSRSFHTIYNISEPLELEIKTFLKSVEKNETVKYTSIQNCIELYKNLLIAN